MSTSKASKPAKSILNPAFRYRPSHATDVRETFARVRGELAQLKDNHLAASKVFALNRKEPQ